MYQKKQKKTKKTKKKQNKKTANSATVLLCSAGRKPGEKRSGSKNCMLLV